MDNERQTNKLQDSLPKHAKLEVKDRFIIRANEWIGFDNISSRRTKYKNSYMVIVVTNKKKSGHQREDGIGQTLWALLNKK